MEAKAKAEEEKKRTAEVSEESKYVPEGYEQQEDCFLCQEAKVDCFWPVR